MSAIIESFRVTTVSGAPIDVMMSVTTPNDGRVLRRATVSASGSTIEGWLEGPHPVPEVDLAHYHELRARGASHYALLGNAILALNADAAMTIQRKTTVATLEAARLKLIDDATRCEEIRATRDVRRVLRHSPSWPDQYALCEAYQADPASGYEPFVKFGLPAADVPVHPRCPSLPDVCTRSELWGAFPGHGNTLRLVSDEDWALLIAETAQMTLLDAQRAEDRALLDAALLTTLKAVSIPTYALDAFQRFRGDFDAAWESEDETAALAILQYGAAIEAQGLAFRAFTPQEMPVLPQGA